MIPLTTGNCHLDGLQEIVLFSGLICLLYLQSQLHQQTTKVVGKMHYLWILIILFIGTESVDIVTVLFSSNPATENSALTVSCSPTGCNSQCTFTWSSPPSFSDKTTPSVKTTANRQETAFTCTARDINGTQSGTSNLQVHYPPSSAWAQISESATITLLEHTFFPPLLCQSDICNPNCSTASWTLPNGTVLAGLELFLNTVTRNDNGVYTCNRSNTVGSKQTTFSISVLYGPKTVTIPPKQILVEGSAWEQMTCTADPCNPPCSYKWFGPNGFSADQPSITGILGTVKRNQKGRYTCNAVNTETEVSVVASVDVDVQYPPDVSVYITSSGTLMCTASGNPIHYVFRPFEHQVHGQVVRTVMGDDLGKTGVRALTFSSLSYQDYGIYTCRVSNGIPSDDTTESNSTTKTVNVAPVITSMTPNYDTAKGKNLDVEIFAYSLGDIQGVTVTSDTGTKTDLFQVTSHNITVDFYGTDIMVPSTEGGYKLLWSVKVTNESQFQTYSVNISNNIGSTLREISFTPKGAPDIPFDLQIENTDTSSITITLYPGYHGGANQTLFVEYSTNITSTSWTIGANMSYDMEKIPYIKQTLQVTHLEANRLYYFRAYSENIYDTSQVSEVVNSTTLALKSEVVTNIGAIVGACFGGIVVISLIIIFVILLVKRSRRKDNKGTSKPNLPSRMSLDAAQNKYGNVGGQASVEDQRQSASESSAEAFYQNTQFNNMQTEEQPVYGNQTIITGTLLGESDIQDSLAPVSLPHVEDQYMAMGINKKPSIKDGQYIEFSSQQEVTGLAEEAYVDLSTTKQSANLTLQMHHSNTSLEQQSPSSDMYMQYSHQDPGLYENYKQLTGQQQEIYMNYT